MEKRLNALNNNTDTDYNNNLVGTNTILCNSDIYETVSFKGCYSSNILFPILTTSSLEKQKTHEQENNLPLPLGRIINNPCINNNIDKTNTTNTNIVKFSTTRLRKNGIQRIGRSNTLMQISDPDENNNNDCDDDLLHPTAPPNKVPSYFARILAPPTPFAEGSSWARRDLSKKHSGVVIEGISCNRRWPPLNSHHQGEEFNETEADSFSRAAPREYQRDQRQQEDHSLSELKTSARSLQVHTPNFTENSSNLSSFLNSQDLFYPSFDDMGWGQPNVGKRVRQDSPNPNQQNENQPDPHNHNSGYSASESETDEEIRGHLIHKRSRDVSPVRSTPGLMDFTKNNTVPLNVNSSVNALSVCRIHVKQPSDDENVSYTESLEPISSLSSDSCHSISVASTTSHTMLNSAQMFSNTNLHSTRDRDRDVELGLGHFTSSKPMIEIDDEAQYLDNFPSDCFLGPHGNVIFPTPPPLKNQTHNNMLIPRNNHSQQHHGTVSVISANEQQQQQQEHQSRFSMATPVGCPPPPPPPQTLPNKFMSYTRAEKESMVVPGPLRESEILSSTSSSTSGASSSSETHAGDGTLESAQQSPPRSAVPRFKGPRVPTATKAGRTCSKNFAKNGGTPQYAYSLLRAVKNPKQTATTMGKNVHESEEDEESETDLDEGDGDGDGNTDNDTMTGLKGDEAVEDDASTSTDIALPNIVRKIVPPIRPSYFPNVPPYINFCLHDEKSETLPAEIRKHLKWRMSTITPIVIKKTVANSGFRLLKKTTEWGGQWGKHMKGAMFRSTLKEYQKLNHLPATFQLGRKDRLWKNIYRFILKYGKAQYGFLPRTYILPHDMKQLKHAWDAAETRDRMWIIKPPAGARGTGIRVINKWNQVPKKRPVIVQQYISKPLLINDRKFDLRLYVLVTNFHPLKIYLYDDGLVRFAPVKYSHDSKRVSDRFMHLTNYSVNKNCELYTQNEDANACKGHKWTLKTLWRYMRSNGTDTAAVMKRIEDIVIKTLISAEDCITSSAFNMPSRYNGYELFGFDIILDESLKPWLLEVNISPSLHSSSPLDLAVKGPLVKEVFNIVGYHLPPSLSKHAKKTFVERLDKELELEKPTFDRRIYCNATTKDEKMKQQVFKGKYDDRSQYLTEILETLTPDDVRHLIAAEDELSQCNGFNRIFPTRGTHSYFGFFESPRYYNMLLDAWESKYEGDRAPAIIMLQELCRNKLHLITSSAGPQPIYENQSQGDTYENDSGDGEYMASGADNNIFLEPMTPIPLAHVPISSRCHPVSMSNNPGPTGTETTATTITHSGEPIYYPYPASERIMYEMGMPAPGTSSTTTRTGDNLVVGIDVDIDSSDEGFQCPMQHYENEFNSTSTATEGELPRSSQPQSSRNINNSYNSQAQQQQHGSPAAVKMERCIVLHEGGNRTAMKTNLNHLGPVSSSGISMDPGPLAPAAIPVREEIEFSSYPPHPPHTVTYHHMPLTTESGLSSSSIINGNVSSNNNNGSSHASTTPAPVNEYNKIKGVCY